MSDQSENEEDTRRLVVAITDFLRDQLIIRTDMVPEDRDCLEIAIQCLEMAYGLEAQRYMQYRFSRPLLDIFNQVTNPVSIKDKLRADSLKDEGNSYMRRNMFENAETEFTNAIELDRWNAIYYCNRASSRIEQRKYFEAISDCRQALVLNPDYAKAHARMGQAYALIQRPREAARCFRQALELDPSNERYRNNLRVAESQVTRPDAMGIIASLIGSLFGLAPPGPEEESSGGRSMPTSFMIITESHPPRTESEPESTDSSQNDGAETEASRDPPAEEQNIVYPQPYGVIDEGEEEQPILQLVMDEQGSNEFSMDFPSFIIFQDSSTASSMDSEGVTEREVGQEQESETSQAGEKTRGDLSENEKDSSMTGMSVGGGEEKKEISPDVDSKPSNGNAILNKTETENVSSSQTTSDKQKDSKQTDDVKIPDDTVETIDTKEQEEELDNNRNDNKDLPIDHKQDNASRESEKDKKENDSEPKEGEKPADKIVLATDPAMLNSSKSLLRSKSDPNTEEGSKEDSDINNRTESNNSVGEKESKSPVESSTNNNIIDDKESKNAGMKTEHSSFSSETERDQRSDKEKHETAEKEKDQAAEKEKDQAAEKEKDQAAEKEKDQAAEKEESKKSEQ